MYQTDFLCTYKLMNKLSYQDELYRIQILQAFNLEKWNDNQIHDTIGELYLLLKDNDEIKQIINKAKKNDNINNLFENVTSFANDNGNDNDNDSIIFTILFNFSTFDLLHRIIIDFLINNTIEERFSTNLLNAL